MPQPDNRRATGSATQTSQQVVGPQGQQSANISAVGMGAAQVGPSVQIGQQAQIRDAGTALYEAISGAARGVQQGIQNYEDMYKMVSERDYANFETEYVKQSELVKGDRQKMRAWLSNNTYQPNRVTAKRYWNLHADVNLKAYEEDQLDILRDFSFRTKDLLPDDKMNEMEQMLKKLDPESPAAMRIEQDLVKLSSEQVFENRRIQVSGMETKYKIENEQLISNVKKNHGSKYDMQLSSTMFQQLLAARTLGVVEMDAENAGITYGNQSYSFEDFPPELMPNVIEEMSERGMSLGADVYGAHIGATNLPRSLLGNSQKNQSSPSDILAAQQEMFQVLKNNPSGFLATLARNSGGDPVAAQKNFQKGLNSILSAKPQTTEEAIQQIDNITAAMMVFDEEEFTRDKWQFLTPEGDDPSQIRTIFKKGYQEKLDKARNHAIEVLAVDTLKNQQSFLNNSLSPQELAIRSHTAFGQLHSHLSTMTTNAVVVTTDLEGNVHRLPIDSEELENGLPANRIFTSLEIEDSRVDKDLEWSEDGSVVSRVAPNRVNPEANRTTNQQTAMIRQMIERSKMMERIRNGNALSYTEADSNEFIRRASVNGDYQGILEAALRARGNGMSLLIEGEGLTQALNSTVESLDGDTDSFRNFDKKSKGRTFIHELYKVSGDGDQESLINTMAGDSKIFQTGLIYGIEGTTNLVEAQTLLELPQINTFTSSMQNLNAKISDVPLGGELVIDELDNYQRDVLERINEKWSSQGGTVSLDAPGYKQFVRYHTDLMSRNETLVSSLESGTPGQNYVPRIWENLPPMPGQSKPSELRDASGRARETNSESFSLILGNLADPEQRKAQATYLFNQSTKYSGRVEEAGYELHDDAKAEIFSIAIDDTKKKEQRQREIASILSKLKTSKEKPEDYSGDYSPRNVAGMFLNEIQNPELFGITPRLDLLKNGFSATLEGSVNGTFTSVYYSSTPNFDWMIPGVAYSNQDLTIERINKKVGNEWDNQGIMRIDYDGITDGDLEKSIKQDLNRQKLGPKGPVNAPSPTGRPLGFQGGGGFEVFPRSD